MRFPYRVVVQFSIKEAHQEPNNKLKTIFKINQFLTHEAKGEYTKWNVYGPDKHENRVYTGIEIGFSDNKDAVHFKLGFISDGEKISGDVHRAYEEERVQA